MNMPAKPAVCRAVYDTCCAVRATDRTRTKPSKAPMNPGSWAPATASSHRCPLQGADRIDLNWPDLCAAQKPLLRDLLALRERPVAGSFLRPRPAPPRSSAKLPTLKGEWSIADASVFATTASSTKIGTLLGLIAPTLAALPCIQHRSSPHFSRFNRRGGPSACRCRPFDSSSFLQDVHICRHAR